jgi:hypothetical protein
VDGPVFAFGVDSAAFWIRPAAALPFVSGVFRLSNAASGDRTFLLAFCASLLAGALSALKFLATSTPSS